MKGLKTILIGVSIFMAGGLMGCLDTDQSMQLANSLSDKILGVTCELEEGCAPGFRCDAVMEDGVVIEGVCLLDQGRACNVDYDLCSRGLVCTVSTSDSDRTICMPQGCMVAADCAEGQNCVNGQCDSQTSCP